MTTNNIIGTTANRLRLIGYWVAAILWAIAVHTIFPTSRRREILSGIPRKPRPRRRFYLDLNEVKIEVESASGLALIEFDPHSMEWPG